MKSMLKMLLTGSLIMAALWLLLFAPAGTLHYWQAWLFFGVLVLASWIASIYLLRTDPAMLQRRMPASESRPVQKALIWGVYTCWIALVVVSSLDHRFGWSHVPVLISVLGYALVVGGIVGAALVFAQNSHAATTIRVEENQPLISTGIYGIVRHPMYTANTLLYFGTPLALGSYWGLIFAIPAPVIFALRIHDEETLLQEELAGYHSYMTKVPHRLVPLVW
ncbi:methyltransferase family protein [Mycolicibacterium lutetiense]|uniref:Protein-S-isoprenylcysteine O-methyltransferase Ste14 n=1 Tax=Mycolicibacterium lutetiense TaxID=1641992 RepID=A0ABS5A3J9_9MYCO|nr:isoprenylcysteine carboxylmethyltransferase family protein [Mycolicibacterium lutetiense]MBP2455956.1 protein-S-isoprenylcysteine O-methyltransferase Ste14 [Mycolicibacterium lutetiense]